MPLRPIDSWPPLPPHKEGYLFALEAVLRETRPILFDHCRRFATKLRRATAEDLTLHLKDDLDSHKLKLVHGITVPTRKRGAKKILRVPNPLDTLDILNAKITKEDRYQIGRLLVHEYVYAALANQADTGCEEEGAGEMNDQEPWAEPCAQFDIGLPPEHNQIWEQKGAHECDDIAYNSFLEIAEKQSTLRQIYEALMNGYLSEQQLAM